VSEILDARIQGRCEAQHRDLATEMADTQLIVASELLAVLLAGRNPDGTWGYFAGRTGRLEPTSWATLALVDSGTREPDLHLSAGMAVFLRRQQPRGLLADVPDAIPNLAFNGLAALVVRRLRERGVSVGQNLERVEERLLGAILATKGIKTDASSVMRQNNRLQGWPWTESTFSWVEPTSWCLLALKRGKRTSQQQGFDAQSDEADQLLIDRCCKGGGWNYGNSNVFGKDLRPYVPTTAVALMALQDQRGAHQVTRSLEWMTENSTRELSGFALSLALLASTVFRQEAGPVDQLLGQRVKQISAFGNLATVAMAAFALTRFEHGAAAFTI